MTRSYIGRVYFLQVPVYIKEPDSSAIRQVVHALIAKVHWVKPTSPQVDPESGLLSLKQTMYGEDNSLLLLQGD